MYRFDGRAAPPLSDEFLIEIHPIGQEYIGNRALILVVAISLERDFFPKGKVRDGVLGLSQDSRCY
jgi:hypothetical protein